MERIKEVNGFTIEKETIPQTHTSSKDRFFVDHINGRSFGNYETLDEACEVFNEVCSSPVTFYTKSGPDGCECDNTHEASKTVCRVCWDLGYRYETAWWNELRQNKTEAKK